MNKFEMVSMVCPSTEVEEKGRSNLGCSRLKKITAVKISDGNISLHHVLHLLLGKLEIGIGASKLCWKKAPGLHAPHLG